MCTTPRPSLRPSPVVFQSFRLSVSVAPALFHPLSFARSLSPALFRPLSFARPSDSGAHTQVLDTDDEHRLTARQIRVGLKKLVRARERGWEGGRV